VHVRTFALRPLRGGSAQGWQLDLRATLG
jgi:hypothetical protein